MRNIVTLLSHLKSEVVHLEEVRAKIEQFQAPDPADNNRRSHLRAYEDVLAAQLVTTAMRYHSTVKWEGWTPLGRGLPIFAGWKKRVALALSGLKS
jgi:hypothetical protein